MENRVAIFPGSFDPITSGHLDIIERACAIFGSLIVAVGHNPEKEDLFTPAERVEMIEQLVGSLPNVQVESYEGLTIDFALRRGAHLILRGIRDGVDLRDELSAANTNLIVGGIETVFLLAAERYALTSSTFIKQIVAMGGKDTDRLSALVPAPVLARLRRKYRDGP